VYNLSRQPHHRSSRRVRNPSTVGQIHSALHIAIEASERSARVRYLLLLATLRFRELLTSGNAHQQTMVIKTAGGMSSHVILQLLEMLMLLGNLLLQL
jgi:hypothetical protein